MINKTVVKLFFAPMLLVFAAFIAAPAYGQNFQPGAVFVMTNAANANQVIAFSRGVDGLLIEQGRFGTGGRGSGGAKAANMASPGTQARVIIVE